MLWPPTCHIRMNLLWSCYQMNARRKEFLLYFTVNIFQKEDKRSEREWIDTGCVELNESWLLMSIVASNSFVCFTSSSILIKVVIFEKWLCQYVCPRKNRYVPILLDACLTVMTLRCTKKMNVKINDHINNSSLLPSINAHSCGRLVTT